METGNVREVCSRSGFIYVMLHAARQRRRLATLLLPSCLLVLWIAVDNRFLLCFGSFLVSLSACTLCSSLEDGISGLAHGRILATFGLCFSDRTGVGAGGADAVSIGLSTCAPLLFAGGRGFLAACAVCFLTGQAPAHEAWTRRHFPRRHGAQGINCQEHGLLLASVSR